MRFIYIPVSLFLIAAATVLGGCSGATENDTNTEEQPVSDNLVRISNEQFKAEKMQLGNSVTRSFSHGFSTNGIVTASPQDKADVYVYVSGMVKSISVNLGSFVRKGTELCRFESKEFISMQQQYLVLLAQLKATEANYNRTKALFDEKVASQKEYYAIESDFKMLQAKLKALQAELKILSIDIKNLEKGNIETYLSVVSPIEGYITEQTCNLGQFVDSQKLLFRVIDNRNLQLHFFVYQENIDAVRTGQVLNIYSPDNREITFGAKIISIGKSIDPETKSIKCIAELENNSNHRFISGMYFQVDVKTDAQDATAIPSEAVMKIENKFYILVKEKQDADNIYFSKKEVVPGLVSDGFTQITGSGNLNDVLIKGTYYYENE
ncbi:MAG: efflux RND transporter periplasmic adaptor subunit [Draconibacterium sp.]|nr:efflux RND transporter periplasmic adaptor subunit [Draconibacterium sp.]